jgi:hypothetical protein
VAHYRRGRKVPALPPTQRLAVGLLTVVAVFTVVALVAWKPALLVLPGLVAVAALGVFDRIVVATPAGEAHPQVRGAAAGRAGPAVTVDPNAPTTAVPRISAAPSRRPPPDRHADRVEAPTRFTRTPGPIGPPPPPPGPPAGRPEPGGHDRRHDHGFDHPPEYDYEYEADYGAEYGRRSHPPTRPVQPPTDIEVDMATMAIDMRAFLDP